MVLTGSEKAFAAGADIAVDPPDLDYMDAYKGNFITRNWERLKTFRKPVIAAVSAALRWAGGCEVGDDVRHRLSPTDNGALCAALKSRSAPSPGAGGTQRLPRAIGKTKAMEMCLTGRLMDAAEAERAGLVARVFPADQVVDEALKTATTIAGYSLPVLMMLKESVNRAFESSLNEGLLFERRTLHSVFALADRREGMEAFIAKRPPTFTHR